MEEVVFRLAVPPQALKGKAPDMHGLVEGPDGQPILCWVLGHDGNVKCRCVSVVGYVMERMDQDVLDALP